MYLSVPDRERRGEGCRLYPAESSAVWGWGLYVSFLLSLSQSIYPYLYLIITKNHVLFSYLNI